MQKKTELPDLQKLLFLAQASCATNKEFSISFAFGIAEYDGEKEINDAIRLADERMYAQKAEQK